MTYHPVDDKTFGFIIEQGKFLGILVSKNKRAFTFKAFECQAEEAKNLLDSLPEVQDALFISSLPPQETLIRRLKIKLTSPKAVEEAFNFQVEPLLPYPFENALLDKWVIEKQEDASWMGFGTVKKEVMRETLKHFEELGLDPEVLSIEPIALCHLANYCSAPVPLCFLVHLGETSSSCLLMKEGKLVSFHTIAGGLKTLEEGQSLASFLQLIEWNLLAQLKETKLTEKPALLVTGAARPDIEQALQEHLALQKITLTSPDPSFPPELLAPYAIPLGLALSAQPKAPSPVNFRSQEFTFSKPWKRFKRPLYLYAGLCGLLAIATYFLGVSAYRYQENRLKEQYLALLTQSQKPYEDFEKSFEKKFGVEERVSLEALTSSGLYPRLDFLEKEIRAMPDTFPLYPQVPKVTETLAWLSTHPVLKCSGSEGDDCFRIDSFHYTMVKRPEQTKKNEKYQVKIDLEFSTSSPRLAREFHDALINPNDFVDPQGEIKWNATKGKYRTSFFLKDKTFYPGPLKS